MEYRFAIKTLFDKYGVNALANPFLALSRLSDLIGNDLYSKRLVNLLFIIMPSIDLVDLFSKRSLTDARQQMNIVFLNYKNSCTAKEYVDTINPVSEYLNPSEFKTAGNKKHSVVCAKACVKKGHVGVKTNHVKAQHQLVVPKPHVQSTPVTPPKRKRVTPRTARNVMVTANANSFQVIRLGSNDKPTLTVNGLIDKSYKPLISSGIEFIFINKPNDNVVLGLPDVLYNQLDFKIDAKRVQIGIIPVISFKAVNMNIEGRLGKASLCGDITNLNCNLKDAKLNIYGDIKNLNGKQERGNIDLRTDFGQYSDYNLNWDNSAGSITVTVLRNPSLKPRNYKMLTVGPLNKIFKINNSKVALSLKTKKGFIKVW